MKEADAIIANLTPFRGPSADTGTVYELGYMAAAVNSVSDIQTIPRRMSTASNDLVPSSLMAIT